MYTETGWAETVTVIVSVAMPPLSSLVLKYQVWIPTSELLVVQEYSPVELFRNPLLAFVSWVIGSESASDALTVILRTAPAVMILLPIEDWTGLLFGTCVFCERDVELPIPELLYAHTVMLLQPLGPTVSFREGVEVVYEVPFTVML